DPRSALPARGTGRWLGPAATDVVAAMFDAARIGRPGGLNMIEVRHTDSEAHAPDGALTEAPAPFLLHAVGAAPDDEAKRRVDEPLGAVEAAARITDAGRAAPAFRDGQPDASDAWSAAELVRLRNARAALDPDRVLRFQRHPAF